ncbi:type II secretion system F family protein [Candidatus Woesearchaeota archaeon]|nr:type II secretion system F family protein [Candidatus Woesearchaeota archaeon]
MAEQKPALMVLPLGMAQKLAKPLRGLSYRLKGRFKTMDHDLKAAELEMDTVQYLSITIVNVIFTFLLFFGLLFVLNFTVQGNPALEALKKTLMYSGIIVLLIGYSLLNYPKIMAGKIAEQIDKNLVFAIKDLLMQVSSGVSLFNGMINVSMSDYGQVSKEFGKIVQLVNSGVPMDKALEVVAVRTKSDYLKRVVWQLINTLKAGSSLKAALRTIVKDLTIEQRSKIKDYASELNLWSLIYMLFAVAVPTIGAVMLVILSSFAGMGIGKGFFIAFICICFAIQYVMIGFIKARRPVVNF